jgi:hypothetical protein
MTGRPLKLYVVDCTHAPPPPLVYLLTAPTTLRTGRKYKRRETFPPASHARRRHPPSIWPATKIVCQLYLLSILEGVLIPR